jgi:hypothetical protein
VPDVDFFNFFRYALGTVVTIYASLVTAQWALGWYKWLQQPQREVAILRRYLLIAALRLRLARFWADTLVCVLLCVTFVILWHAHTTVGEIESAWADAHGQSHPLHSLRGR